MALYNEKKQLYLEIDIYSVRLGASLLQARDRMWYPRYKAPKNTVQQTIVFASRSLTSTETHYSIIQRELLCKLHGLEEAYQTAWQQNK